MTSSSGTLPVVIVVTSGSCGHCKIMRGSDGQLKEPSSSTRPGPVPGGYYWSPSFFRKLITASNDGKGEAKFRVYEINFPNLSPKNVGEASELSEFKLAPTGVTKLTFTPDKKSGVNRTLVKIDNGKPTVYDVVFSDAVLKKVPADLLYFLYVYPAWIYVDGNNWNQALEHKAHLYAHVSGCQVKQIEAGPSPKYGVDTSKKPGAAESPVQTAIEVINGEISLLPGDSVPRPEVTPDGPVRIEGYGCRSLGYMIIGSLDHR